MTRAELKQQAKDTLKGRWGTIIGITVVYGIIVMALSLIGKLIPIVGSILALIIPIPLSFGFVGQLIKFSRKEDVGITDFFSIGFKNFEKSWSIVGFTLIKLLPYILGMFGIGIILAIFMVIYFFNQNVGGILLGILPIASIIFMIVYVLMLVKSLLYILTEYIGNDINDLKGKEIVNKSAELMNGHRVEYFVLQLSFIGWALLASFTFGIGLLWLVPYMKMTNIKFYEYVLGNNKNVNDNDEAIKNN